MCEKNEILYIFTPKFYKDSKKKITFASDFTLNFVFDLSEVNSE